MTRPYNVFVMGLNDFHRREMECIHDADRFRFHALFEEDEVVHRRDYAREMLAEAEGRLRAFDGPIDGLFGLMDFPVTAMVPLLCRRFALPGPDPRSVLHCTHKYWSRVAQRELVPECTPLFQWIDPFEPHAARQINLPFPFWLEPVKSYASHLGFRIDDRPALEQALEQIRDEIHTIGDAFDELMDEVALPAHLRCVHGDCCVAKELVGGRELVPEGYVFHGEIGIQGLIAVPRRLGGFDRHQYPAEVDPALARRIGDATRRLMGGIAYDDGCFNVEFLHDDATNKLWVFEVNPSISQSHSWFFEKVDGVSNHDTAVHVAVGERPPRTSGEGVWKVAAKCLHRSWKNGVVERVPDRRALEQIERDFPDCLVHLTVEEGTHLDGPLAQDGDSNVLAEICVCGTDAADLDRRREAIADRLDIRIAPPG